jgi:hypothetical protein
MWRLENTGYLVSCCDDEEDSFLDFCTKTVSFALGGFGGVNVREEHVSRDLSDSVPVAIQFKRYCSNLDRIGHKAVGRGGV